MRGGLRRSGPETPIGSRAQAGVSRPRPVAPHWPPRRCRRAPSAREAARRQVPRCPAGGAYRSPSLKHESGRPACWRGRLAVDSQQPGRTKADRGGPEATEPPRLAHERLGPDQVVAGAVKGGVVGAVAARQNAAGVPVSPSCSPQAGRSRRQSPARSPESGASSAIRAETMFDKTRLPYVALDVLCVLLGTYAPPARGACAREPGVGRIGGMRACVRWEVTRRESRTGVGGVCLTREPCPARRWGGGRLPQPGDPASQPASPRGCCCQSAFLSPARALSPPCLDAVHASALHPSLSCPLFPVSLPAERVGSSPLCCREAWWSLAHQVW